MKKNDERILKYLSEMMDENERVDFEKELISSTGLANDLASINSRLEKATLPKIIDVDERYFANLVPRVHEQLRKKKKNIFWKSAYYLTPTAAAAAAAAAVLFIFLFTSKTELETQYKDLANEVVSNFSDQEVSEKYFTELESNPADIVLTADTDELSFQIPSEVEINTESYTRLIDNPVSEDYRTLNGLSEKELEIVYEKLNSESSQKVIK